MKINRFVWIVLDSVGMGEMPDADLYGDCGSDTLGNISKKTGGLKIPNMVKLGLGNIDGIHNIEKTDKPMGAYGRNKELSNGKDTTTGHWEMVGIYTKKAFRTFPNGFPKEVIDEFVKRSGIPGVLGNCVASGTTIIEELGEEHIATKKPIIYTSADSVFQIAVHEKVYPPEKLYELCKIAREILQGEYEVGRVIARPFIDNDTNDKKFLRTANRRDFSVLPPDNNLLNYMKDAGLSVIGVGKIEDIFAKEGITEAIHTKDNQDGIDVTIEYMKKDNKGLIFTNLVEFDSKWGHRNDYMGYAKGLEEFDARLEEIIAALKEDDVLIITADHGCDPTTISTDHSREYVPLLIYGNCIKDNINLGTRDTFADIGQTIADNFDLKSLEIGKSMLPEIIK